MVTMDNSIVDINNRTTAVQSFNRETIDLIKRTVAPKLTDSELQLFLYTSQRFGLDPLARQIYAVKRSSKYGEDKMTIQTGIDGFRLIANRSGLAGIDDAIFDTETETHPNKATITVWRMVEGQRVPFTASARWSEYVVDSNTLWKKLPYAMLAKCAESLALRKGFPAELSGVYTTEEMMQSDVLSPETTEELPLTEEEALNYTVETRNNGNVKLRDMDDAQLVKLRGFMKKPLDIQRVDMVIAYKAKHNAKDVTDTDNEDYAGTPFAR